MNRLLLLLLPLVAPAALAGTTICVSPDEPACEATIQAGLDAASPGDVVEVRRRDDGGPYVEILEITTADLTLRGAEPMAFMIDDSAALRAVDWLAERAVCSPIWLTTCGLGAFGGCERNTITIDAPGVTITDLSFAGVENAAILREAGASLLTVDRNCFIGGRKIIGDDQAPVDDLVLTRNRAFNHGTNTRLFGDRIRVEKNLFHLTYGIQVEGADAVVDLNAVHFLNDDEGVDVRGDGATITRNDIVGAVEAGILYAGVGATIAENRIEGVPDGIGIELAGEGFGVPPVSTGQVVVRDNHVIGAGAIGIEVFADDSTVTGNVVERSAISGGFLSGAPSLLGRRNAGIRVRGSDNRIEGNTVTLSGSIGIRNGDGFTPSDRNAYIDNVVSLSAMNGLLVYAGDEITVRANELLDNDGEGLSAHDRADDVTAENNTIEGNRLDVCNCGADLMLSGNRIGSGGADALCVVAAEVGSVCGDLLFADSFEQGAGEEQVLTFDSEAIALEDSEVYEYSYLNWDDANWGGEPNMFVGSRAANLDATRRRAYVKFDIARLGVEARQLRRAELRLHGYAMAEGGTNVQVHPVLGPWEAGDSTYDSGGEAPDAPPGWLSWNQQPPFDDTAVIGATIVDWPPPDAAFTLEITDLVRDWLSGVRDNHGLVLVGEDEGPGRFKVLLRTSEFAEVALRPELIVVTQ